MLKRCGFAFLLLLSIEIRNHLVLSTKAELLADEFVQQFDRFIDDIKERRFTFQEVVTEMNKEYEIVRIFLTELLELKREEIESNERIQEISTSCCTL
jgi:hypothetical protein